MIKNCFRLRQTFKRTAFLRGPTAVVEPYLACISCILVALDACNQPLKFARHSLTFSLIHAYLTETTGTIVYRHLHTFLKWQTRSYRYSRRQRRIILPSSSPFWQCQHHKVRARSSSHLVSVRRHFNYAYTE